MGATQQFPEQERYIYPREYLQDKLAVMMGGRCAESLVFDTATSGAANDLQQATKMARKMVLEWGMSGQFEHMALGSAGEQVFLGEELGKGKEYSEATSQAVDKEVETILRDAFDRARDILSRHRSALDDLAQSLLDHEEVAGEKVYSIAGISR
jgi:cell division protease FtsH